MKAEELRIGNLVLLPKMESGDKTSEFKESVIESIDSIGVNVWQSGNEGDNNWEGEFDKDEIKPIRLTEELLVRFGFIERQTLSYNYYEIHLKHYTYNGLENSIKISISVGYGPNGKLFLDDKFVKYCNMVHDLQNFVYALTEEGLTLK